MIYGILLTILILVAIFLVVFVLMQSDKGGGLAGSLGGMGGGGGLPFSGREAATILSKVTTGLAIAFMAICILLNIMSRNRAHTSVDSALQKRAAKMQHVESKSASSALNRNFLPEVQQPATAPKGATTGKVNIPGVTKDSKKK